MQHLTPATAPRYGFDFCNERADRSQPYRDARRFTDDAIRFMRDNRERAFFLYLPFVAVHGPHVVPPEDQARWRERLKGRDTDFHPDMLASLEFVDRSVGRVLAALDELGLADNTLVVFSSDNGGMSKAVHSAENHPLRMGKGTLYEGGVRVPLFIRWPGHIAPGGRSDVPVHFADLFPTLCDAAGVRIDPKHTLDGVSLRPLFLGAPLPERTLFITYPHYLAGYATTPVRAVVRGRYKLVWHPYDHLQFEGGRVTNATTRYVAEPLVELFDLEADPGEHTNLAAKYPEKATEMKKLFSAWMKETGAKDVTPNAAYDARRPLFNSRDEALGAGNAGKK
jgi:arylsulfatase A-like enzyme